MARTIVDGQLIAPVASRVRFVLATAADDPAIRRLLRENPMRGAIALSFEREPDYFHGAHTGPDDQTILAFDGDQLICMGRCSVRRRYLNGEIRRVGYLAELRLDAAAQGRFDILRRGYKFFRKLHREDPLDFYFTSIVADNERSIRLLERGLPGMPGYERMADFVSLLVPAPRSPGRLRRLSACREERFQSQGLRCVSGSNDRLPELAACLNLHAKQYQLASFWTEEELRSLHRLGLPLADFQLALNGTGATACAALWDQRCFRQLVIRGYGPGTSFARPWINLAAGFLETPRLPPLGSTLAHALLSPVAVPAEETQLLLATIEAALIVAAERGLEFLALGFASEDPRLATIRSRFHCREYVSRLYRVRWNDTDQTEWTLDGRLCFPEIALL